MTLVSNVLFMASTMIQVSGRTCRGACLRQGSTGIFLQRLDERDIAHIEAAAIGERKPHMNACSPLAGAGHGAAFPLLASLVTHHGLRYIYPYIASCECREAQNPTLRISHTEGDADVVLSIEAFAAFPEDER